MKKLIIPALCLFALALSANAQDTQDKALIKQQLAEKGISLRMSYDDYKELYNPRDYVREEFDPYSPVGTGIASFFITGLGQMINGEGGRGAGMLCGHIGLVTAGILTPFLWTTKNEQGKNVTTNGGVIVCITCLCGALALNIWSIVDAVNMAKVKNLYYRDCRLLSALPQEIKLLPSLTTVPKSQSFQYAPGLTLAIKF